MATAKKNTNSKPKVKTEPKEEEKKQEQKTLEQTKTPQIKAQIERLFDVEGSKVKAIANANIGESFAVHGMRVIDSDKGLFVAMPSRSYDKDGKTIYEDLFHPITSDARKELNSAVLKAYEQKLEETQEQSQEQSQDVEEDPVLSQQQM